MILLFVYGSLRSGYHNHDMLRTSELVGEDSITAIDVSFPPRFFAIIEGEGIVKGEVYNVDNVTMRRIDDLEGTDVGMYIKREVLTHNKRKVVVYFASQELAALISRQAATYAMMEDSWEQELENAA